MTNTQDLHNTLNAIIALSDSNQGKYFTTTLTKLAKLGKLELKILEDEIQD